jgi:hypothetical protein
MDKRNDYSRSYKRYFSRFASGKWWPTPRVSCLKMKKPRAEHASTDGRSPMNKPRGRSVCVSSASHLCFEIA